ncbi:phage tail tip lysozyme [Nocardia pneumoniae]|uniref:phage tail tip lysozyme n=1 Tax=Nocardia pneumoniae TaxID=228601 RepID=UPI000594EBE8|nr:phage tail tip lysozyme [Nocardia pneumoniae]
MSPDGTKRLGDLHELPACAPAGLKALFTAAEGIIQTQVQLLGSGTPSKAPDLRQLLRARGIAKPEDQSTMIDRYGDNKDKMENVTSGINRKDDGIVVQTAGIGEVVTKAYGAIDTAVGELNGKIDASHNAVRTVTEKTGEPETDEHGNVKKELPKEIINGLFTGVWSTLNTTYTQVSGVSDQAAAAALQIRGDEPSFTPTSGNNNSGIQPVSYPTSGYNGTTPWTRNSGSMGTAIIPTADKPDAMAMMEYLINTHHFTPAQAAGIVANAKFESGFRVDATGDDGTAKGIFQWRFDREAGLRTFASKPGESLGNWETHVDYMAQELRTDPAYQRAETLIDSNPNDPRAVAEAFDRYYEKSSGSSINDRREYAAGLLNEWNKSHLAV